MKSFKQFIAHSNMKKKPEVEEPFTMPEKSDILEPLANDLEPVKNEVDKQHKAIKLKDNEWEIVSVIDVTQEEPKLKEAVIINADLGNSEVSRGDIFYITAMLKKKDAHYYSQNVMGVLKCRVTDIYNSLSILNNLK